MLNALPTNFASSPLRGGISAIETIHADIAVIGGGIAGVMAALAAKRENNNVLLIEPSNVLGGQGTTGGVAGFCGDTKNTNTLFAELIRRMLEYEGFIEAWDPKEDRRAYDLEWCAFYLQEMIIEREVEALLHSRVISVETSACRKNPGRTRIQRLLISTAGGLLSCEPGFVIDASGSAIAAVLAGLPVEHLGANEQLPMSLYFTLWDTGRKVRPVLPDGCIRWRNDDEIPMTSVHPFPSGKTEVKMKVTGFDAADGRGRSRAEIFARRQMHSLIYYLQTTGFRGKVFDQHVLSSVSRGIGVREERRIIGEHVLTESEVRHSVVFPDAVAVGTYHLDYHWPDKMQRAGTGITDALEPYHIPLRMMIPRGASNLLVPGRGASGDQMAMSSFRVMATAAQMGFAAGKAAVRCLQYNETLETLDIAALQEEIRTGGQSLDLSDYGIYLRNERIVREFVFEEDLPFAACHASSIARLSNGGFLAAWFAGTKEGAEDVSIWISLRSAGVWSKPIRMERACGEAHWNPVLFVSPQDGSIHLYFKTGKRVYDWVTRESVSRDEGRNWSKAVRVGDGKDQPFGPVKNKPIVLRSGVWLAPNSVEIQESRDVCKWNARVDISRDEGKTWSHGALLDIGRISGWGVIQPALWESGPDRVHMLLRSRCGFVCYSESRDGGISWSPAQATELPATDSGLDVARLDDGTIAAVCNPSQSEARSPLSVFLSFDNGRTWTRKLDIETGDGEFSYPSIIPTRSGMAIVYTWKRKRIAFWHGSQEQCRDEVHFRGAIQEVDKP